MAPDMSVLSPSVRIDHAEDGLAISDRAPSPSDAGGAVLAPPPAGRRSRLSSLFHRNRSSGKRSRDISPARALDGAATHYIPEPEKDEERGQHRRISHRLLAQHHGNNHKNQYESAHIPSELLQVPRVDGEGGGQVEEKWEKHATQLICASAGHQPGDLFAAGSRRPSRCPSPALGNTLAKDDQITVEKAIELHEKNEIAKSTELFRILADPEGENDSISQVFYGLAKRHGWGCAMDPREAFHFLQLGAANAAALSEEASSAGIRHGAYARKVLAMAIYELANCYKNGWGTTKDLVAARHYYETAANLGDTDGMMEAAWCFEKGCGGKKDKFQAAHYYRLARKNGVSMTGMSWIDKPAYQPKD